MIAQKQNFGHFFVVPNLRPCILRMLKCVIIMALFSKDFSDESTPERVLIIVLKKRAPMGLKPQKQIFLKSVKKY